MSYDSETDEETLYTPLTIVQKVLLDHFRINVKISSLIKSARKLDGLEYVVGKTSKVEQMIYNYIHKVQPYKTMEPEEIYNNIETVVSSFLKYK